MKVVSDDEAAVPFLTGRVDKQSRQLPKQSTKVVTLQSLRQMVVNIAKGISGVQYGARPAPLDDIELEELKDVAVRWVGAYADAFQKEIKERDTYLAGAGPVLAAVGAMGNIILRGDSENRPEIMGNLLEMLRPVNWAKGEHWLGIAGNYTT